jgi:hypothetical protein
MNLLSAQFDSHIQFVEANAKILAVNRALEDTANDLARFADN